MDTLDFIGRLNTQGIELHLEEGAQLRIKAPKGLLTPDLREEIKARKADLIVILSQLDAARKGGSESISPAPADAERPLSFAQERLWFIEQLDPGSRVYLMPSAFRVRGRLDVDVLERAFRAVIQRQESLRTAFVAVDGKPKLVIESEPAWSLKRVDFSDLEPEMARHEADKQVHAFVTTPLDLGRAPLFKAELIRLAETEHLLLITMHHIISDGWSLDLFAAEWRGNYNALVNGQPAAYSPLRVQYSDFAYWQRKQLPESDYNAQLARWVEKLKGLETLNLPTDFPRPAHQTSTGAASNFSIKPEVAHALRDLAKGRGMSLFMVVLAAMQALLQRYTGQSDITVGTSIGNRDHREIEGIVGLFVNLLAMRTDVSGDPPFAILLDRVKATVLDAFGAQAVPFEKVVEACGTRRDSSRHPLFQVQLVFTNTPTMGDGPGPGQTPAVDNRSPRVVGDGRQSEEESLRLEPYELGGAVVARLDLTVQFSDRGEHGLAGAVEYNTDLFTQATIGRLTHHLTRLLGAVAQDPNQKLSAIRLLDRAELEQLAEWNRTTADFPREQTVHRAFEEQVSRAATAIALSQDDISWTFDQLNRKANRLAGYLIDQGLEPGMAVGFCLEPGAMTVAVILAILKAGGAYVPLDPGYPEERMAFMIEDAGMTILVTTAQLIDKLPGYQLNFLNVLMLDELDCDGFPEENPHVAGWGESLAYIVYTSGTTGRPKGVQISHRNIMRLVYDHAYVVLEAGMGVAQVSNLSFDALTFELWTALIRGGRLCLVDKETLLNTPAFGHALARDGVGAMFLTSALFSQMAHERPEIFNTVANLLVGGDRVEPEAVRRVKAQGGPQRLVNAYGPTECTTFALWHESGEVSQSTYRIPIGKPIANTTAFVLDHQLGQVPVGITGELYLGGEGLAWGYLNRPELTAVKFLPNPFATRENGGQRLYRTGDLVRRLNDGAIDYLGRGDRQVKVRGYRIELPEIEHHLSAHPDIDEVYLRVTGTATADKKLVAYLIESGAPAAEPQTESGPRHSAIAAKMSTDELRHYLAAKVPAYMMPAAFVFMRAFPLTANGKVNADALPDAGAAPTEEGGFRAPRTPSEEVLAGIWAATLSLERVGSDDNFFDLGGNSLVATQIFSRIREAFQVELPLRELFENPDLRSLAARIDEARLSARGLEVPPLVPQSRSGPIPLSYAQERLWFIDQFDSEGASYNVPLTMRLEGDLDAKALEATFNEIVRRHESLRTHFESESGQAVQVIEAEREVPITRFDLRDQGTEQRELRLAEILETESKTPFNLNKGPMLRVMLIQLENRLFVLMANFHHIAFDGWSLRLLIGEMHVIYSALVRGLPSPLPDLTFQYADFAIWQRGWLTGAILDRQLSYWQEQLRGAPAHLELACDYPRPAVQTFNGRVESFTFRQDLVAAIRKFSQEENATPFMTLLAAFYVFLNKYSGQSDLLVGTPIANRNRAELEGLFGFFVNTLVLRGDLSRQGNPENPIRALSFRDLVKRVRRMALDAYAHQDVPFEQIVERLQPERDMSRSPLFQVMFSLEQVGDGSQSEGSSKPEFLPGLVLHHQELEYTVAKFDLSLGIEDGGSKMTGGFEFNTDLFSARTATGFVDHYLTLVDGLLAEPERELDEVDMIPADERLRLLEEWNQTAWTYAPAQSYAELFERRVALDPEAIALQKDGATMSYAELNRRANRLAHRLIADGVAKDRPVGVLATGSFESVAAFIGIFKAGAAYLPLDPSYPSERLAFMIADAGAGLVLSQSPASAAALAGSGLRIIELEPEWRAFAGFADTNPGLAIEPQMLAYVIYTSGSTGKPKGVGICHSGLVNLCGTMSQYMETTPSDRFLQFASVNFDVSVEEIFPTLAVGARIVFDDRARQCTGVELMDLVAYHGVTLLELPTALWHALVVEMSEAEQPVALPRCLRLMIVGGERINPAYLKQWLALDTARVTWVNGYGPTETTVSSTSYKVSEGKAPWLELLPIGRPMANYTHYILDPAMRLVATGVIGQLFIGGAGVSRGYLGQPALTALKFVPDPFAADPGSRLYATGDLARYMPDGMILCLGRNDGQVKVRGFRIEIGEVERALAGAPGVADAVVKVVKDRVSSHRLVAYLVARTEPPTAEQLRDYLQTRLPEYMIPSAFAILEAFPLTKSGKVNREALPDLGESLAAETRPYREPGGETEKLVAGTWSEMLGLARVGLDDNFFESGGHSLLATRVVSRLRRALGIEFPVRALFEHPRLEDFARYLDLVKWSVGSAAESGTAIQGDDVEEGEL